MLAYKHTFRTLVLWKTVQFSGLFVLVGAIVSVTYLLSTVRMGLVQRQFAAENVLQASVREAVLKAEVAKRTSDVGRVDALLLRQAQFADFISVLEAHAQRYGISMRVSSITEEAASTPTASSTEDKKAEDSSPSSVKNVRVQVIAEGPAAALLRFLYAVDHLPYLVKLPIWELVVHVPGSSGRSTSSKPQDTNDKSTERLKENSRLIMEIVAATLGEGTNSHDKPL